MTPVDMKRVRAFVAAQDWRFAKTMPQWPHWYVLLENLSGEDRSDFLAMNHFIEKYGTFDDWNGKNRWKYLKVDEFKYWNCGCDYIINRADPISNYEMRKRGEKWLRDNGKKVGPYGRPINAVPCV